MMTVIDEGHQYELSSFGRNPDEEQRQPIKVDFMKRVDGNCVMQGTTNEDVLVMLIDRMKYLQAKLPCRENALVITKLEESLMWLERRTANEGRKAFFEQPELNDYVVAYEYSAILDDRVRPTTD